MTDIRTDTVECEQMNGLHLVAITYIRCRGDKLQQFENRLHELLLEETRALHYDEKNRMWLSHRPTSCAGCVIPFLFATTTGAYDFILCMAATSSYIVTQFCAEILRRTEENIIVDTETSVNGEVRRKEEKHKGFGDAILETHTTVAVNNNPEQKIENQLRKLLG